MYSPQREATTLLLLGDIRCDWAVPLTGSSLSKKLHYLSELSLSTSIHGEGWEQEKEYKKTLIKCKKRRICMSIPRKVVWRERWHIIWSEHSQ